MATELYRGSTATIRFSPLGGLKVSELGEPIVAISQELVTLTFENGVEDEEDRVVIDTTNNRISVTLTEEESIQLADGVPTTAQVTWYQYDESEGSDEDADPVITDVLKFPEHSITILPSILDLVLPEDEEPVAADPEEVLDYNTEDPVGNLVVDGGTGEEYVVPGYREYYGTTTEPEPRTTYLYADNVVQPVPNDWKPGDE